MPRKRSAINAECFYKPFPSALRYLMEKNHTTQQELAEVLGKTRQSISYYCDGSSSPDWETLAKIAKFYSVSSDWILGLSDVQSPNADMKSVCDFTGLSEASVESILRETSHEESRQTINAILSFDADSFHSLITNAQKGISIHQKYKDKPFNFETIPEEIRLNLFDYFGIDPDGINYTSDMASERYITKAKNFLELILLEYLIGTDQKPIHVHVNCTFDLAGKMLHEEHSFEEDGDPNGND